ncbi:hypothetical protein SynSYN20_01356 [Synechococcus sp. SYN20]|nr:hypothetical protein SynSYN20_01356 [Synechococcus sp. SYN20]
MSFCDRWLIVAFRFFLSLSGRFLIQVGINEGSDQYRARLSVS